MPSETTEPSLTTTNEPLEQASTCAFFQAAYSDWRRASVMTLGLALFQVAAGTVPRMVEPLVVPLLEPEPAAPLTFGRGESVLLPVGVFLLPLPALEPAPSSAAPASPQAGKNAAKIANSGGSRARNVIEANEPSVKGKSYCGVRSVLWPQQSTFGQFAVWLSAARYRTKDTSAANDARAA